MSYFEPQEYPEFPRWLKAAAIHVDRMAHDGRVKRLFIDMIDEYLDKCSGDQGKQYPDWPPVREMEICEKCASLGAIHDVVCQNPAAGMFVDLREYPKKPEDPGQVDMARTKQLIHYWFLCDWVKELKDDTHKSHVEQWLADVEKPVAETDAPANRHGANEAERPRSEDNRPEGAKDFFPSRAFPSTLKSDTLAKAAQAGHVRRKRMTPESPWHYSWTDAHRQWPYLVPVEPPTPTRTKTLNKPENSE